MDENTNKPGYICGRCGAVTDYPKAFCRKCYREQVCISAFLIVFALVVIAIVNTYFLGNGVRLGAIPQAILYTPPFWLLFYIRHKFRRIVRTTVSGAPEESARESEPPALFVPDMVPAVENKPAAPVAPVPAKLEEKKRELHALDADLVKLRNAKARRATLAAEVKKLDRAARLKNTSRLVVILSVAAALLLIASVVLGVRLSQAWREIAAVTASRDGLQGELDKTASKVDLWQSSYDNLDRIYGELYEKYQDAEAALPYRDFLLNKIGIIIGGSPYYHRYRSSVCSVDWISALSRYAAKPFSAHYVEYCQALGYTACPECYKPFSFSDVLLGN